MQIYILYKLDDKLKEIYFCIRIIITALCFWTATCRPGSRWRVNCKTCTCSYSGVPKCRQRYCRGKRQVSCKLYKKKSSDKLNSSLPKDFSHLEHDAVWFGGNKASFASKILPPTLGKSHFGLQEFSIKLLQNCWCLSA